MPETIRLLLDEPDPTVFIVKLAGLAILAAMLLVGAVTVLECVSLHKRITRPRETFAEWNARTGSFSLARATLDSRRP